MTDFLGTVQPDTLTGSDGDDSIRGRRGDDWLYGGNYGDDDLFGGRGDDNLFGGIGNDTLVGGRGSDTFHFLITSTEVIPPQTEWGPFNPWGVDRVLDFKPGKDTLQINIEVFDPSDVEAVYDPQNGLLSAVVEGEKITLARLDKHLNIDQSDIIVC